MHLFAQAVPELLFLIVDTVPAPQQSVREPVFFPSAPIARPK
jgi:hypothetical protein